MTCDAVTHRICCGALQKPFARTRLARPCSIPCLLTIAVFRLGGASHAS